MKRGIIILILALLAACAAKETVQEKPVVMEEITIVEEETTMPAKPMYEPPPTGPEDADVEVKLDAHENECLPSELIAREGNKVRLIITAQDDDHQFNLITFNIKEDLPKGEDVSIEFVASKKGDFTYECVTKDHSAKTTGKLHVI